MAAFLPACGPDHPSSDSLQEEFEANRVTFEKLADMAAQDCNYSRISYDFTHPNWDLPEQEQPGDPSEQRWQSYRDLFDELDLESGVTIFSNGEWIELNRSSDGLLTAGSSLSFIRAPRSQLKNGYKIISSEKPLECELGDKGVCRVAHHLEDDWYLALERH